MSLTVLLIAVKEPLTMLPVDVKVSLTMLLHAVKEPLTTLPISVKVSLAIFHKD